MLWKALLALGVWMHQLLVVPKVPLVLIIKVGRISLCVSGYYICLLGFPRCFGCKRAPILVFLQGNKQLLHFSFEVMAFCSG